MCLISAICHVKCNYNVDVGPMMKNLDYVLLEDTTNKLRISEIKDSLGRRYLHLLNKYTVG